MAGPQTASLNPGEEWHKAGCAVQPQCPAKHANDISSPAPRVRIGTTEPCTTVGIQFIEPHDMRPVRPALWEGGAERLLSIPIERPPSEYGLMPLWVDTDIPLIEVADFRRSIYEM